MDSKKLTNRRDALVSIDAVHRGSLKLIGEVGRVEFFSRKLVSNLPVSKRIRPVAMRDDDGIVSHEYERDEFLIS